MAMQTSKVIVKVIPHY